MPHGNTIINGDGVELGSIAPHAFNLLLNNLTYIV